MREEIVIVSDLWGLKRSGWWEQYEMVLGEYYAIKFYDACELGAIDVSTFTENAIHKQFVEFGLEQAARALYELERDPKIYIGCSVGGSIVWKAGQLGLPIQKLIGISATRLRKEISLPHFPVELYYGDQDPFIPSISWIKALGTTQVQLLSGDHNIYTSLPIIQEIGRKSALI